MKNYVITWTPDSAGIPRACAVCAKALLDAVVFATAQSGFPLEDMLGAVEVTEEELAACSIVPT